MELKAAVGQAFPFYTSDQVPYSCVQLGDGRLRAMTPERGIDLNCPVATVECSVAAEPVSKILRAMKSEVEISLAKGRKLQIEGEGGRYKVQAIPATSAFEFPVVPSSWTPVPAHVVQALGTMERLADPDGPLAGVYIDSQRAIAGNMRQVAIAYHGVVPFPCRVPVGFFKGLEGDCQFAPEVRPGESEAFRLWVEDSQGSRRWTQLYHGEYPVGSIDQMVTHVRGAVGRFEAKVDFQELGKLAARASAISEGHVDACKLQLAGPKLTITGGNSKGKWGATDFSGSIDITSMGTAHIGVTGMDLQKAAGVLGGMPQPHRMALSAQAATILDMWAGNDVVIEVLIVPVHLPA